MGTTQSSQVIKLSLIGNKPLIMELLIPQVTIMIFGDNFGKLMCPLNKAISLGES
jgi:hypothetical protein